MPLLCPGAGPRRYYNHLSTTAVLLVIWWCILVVMCVVGNTAVVYGQDDKIYFPDDRRLQQRSHNNNHRCSTCTTTSTNAKQQQQQHMINMKKRFIDDTEPSQTTADAQLKPNPEDEESLIPDNSTIAADVPLEFIRNVWEHEQNLLNFIMDEPNDADKHHLHLGAAFFSFGSRFGGHTNGSDFEERGAVKRPPPASCEPELQTIRLAHSEDHSILFIPECTRVEQCGGCCQHPLLTCQPNATELVPFTILKTQYMKNGKLKVLGNQVVTVERHINCSCDCKIQPKDCQPYQEFVKGVCACVCLNRDEQEKCLSETTGLRLWNADICACQCKHVLRCSTGSVFSHAECKCVAERRRAAVISKSP